MVQHKDGVILYLSGYRPLVSEKVPLVYLSGRTATNAEVEEEWLKRTGCKYRCFSFAYVCPGAFYYNKAMHAALDITLKRKVGVMMDSGAHSFHNFAKSAGGTRSNKKKNKVENIEDLREETIQHYVRYCKKEGKKWDFYVTFDYKKHAPTIYKITRRLTKMGINPAPVFHGDTTTDWLKRYLDEGHRMIGIGSTGRTYDELRYYFDEIFGIAEKYKGVKFHGFAFTSMSLMWMYPWYSVDSATWVKTAAYGKIITVDPERNILSQLHVSTKHSKNHTASYSKLSKQMQRSIAEQVEAHGFDIDKVRSDLQERCTFNGYIYSHLNELVRNRASVERVQWNRLL